MTATPTRIEHDLKRENYRKSRRMERDYVRPYVDKMNACPAPRFVRSVEYQELVESVGMKRAATIMREVERG